jgi:hypothetical protein
MFGYAVQNLQRHFLMEVPVACTSVNCDERGLFIVTWIVMSL